MGYTYAGVDLSGALAHNIRVLKSRLDCKFMAVVKSDAYGHGIVEVSNAALSAGAEYLGVARPQEGVSLRNAGINAPILVLGAILESDARAIVHNGLTQTVFSKDICSALEREAESMNRPCRVHIKADTGMNRVGLRTSDEFSELLTYIDDCPHITAEGVFTHFAVSESADKTFTRQQFERFMPFVAIAKKRNMIAHCANSGAALDLADEMRLDMVRCGIAMYGYHPGRGCGDWAELKPVLTWKTAVVQVKEIYEGDTVSYGRNYTAKGRRLIATIPVGYGDGLKRCLTGKASVLVGGRRVPIIGTICMDQCMLDITDAPGVSPGDEAVLIGEQGGVSIWADEMADWAGTIPYEVLLSITDRVERVYK